MAAESKGKKGEKKRKKKDHSHIGSDIPRTNSVHLDIILCPLITKRLSQLCKSTLSSRIRRDSDASLKIEEWSEIDDLATSKRNHVSTGSTGEEEDGFEVDGKDLGWEEGLLKTVVSKG